MMTRRGMMGALLSCAAAPLRAAGTLDNSIMMKAAQLIQDQVDHGGLKGAALQVHRGDEVFRQSFGTAELDSMFLLGSITKPFTAVAVMILVDEGELRLKDPASKYVPEFSEGAKKDVTVEQLLIHTSGLPDQLQENNALRARHAPLTDFVRGTCSTPLLFAPGTRYLYQSMGILLAAEIVERVSRMPLPKFLADRCFKPLGMHRTVLGLGGRKKSDMMPMQTEHAAPESGGGDPDAKNWDWNSDYWRNLAAPWGGAHSTIGDLTLFLRSFLHPDGRVLRPETARLMIQNHTPGLQASRGIGFMVGPEGFGSARSPRTFGHSGSTGTLAWADPATDTSFVLLTTLPKNVSGERILKPVSTSFP